jgi:DNA-binding PadR family transcriptional regulator
MESPLATLPIYLEVEDVAVGPVLIALRKMPGIIKLNLDLMSGAPATPPVRREPGAPSNSERIVAALVQRQGEPLSIKEAIEIVGGSKGTAYTAMYQLKKQGVVKGAGGGSYELTDKAKRELIPVDAVKLLPKPRDAKASKTVNGHAKKDKIARGPKGRASPGQGRKLLLDALAGDGVTRADLRHVLGAQGISEKSFSGVLDRAKRDELIQKVGNVYELTASGKTAQAQAPTGE